MQTKVLPQACPQRLRDFSQAGVRGLTINTLLAPGMQDSDQGDAITGSSAVFLQ